MKIWKYIKCFICGTQSVTDIEAQGQSLSDTPLQPNIGDAPVIDDGLRIDGDHTEQQHIETQLGAESKENSIDDIKSIVSELEHESELETASNAVTHDAIKEKEIVHQYRDTSLIDNAAYMSLAEKCCDIISELDSITTNENADMSDLIKMRIKEALLCSGAEPISDESTFDILRHKAEGKSIVRKGTPISSTIEPGIAIGDKVMVKAKVKIKRKD